MKQLWFATFSIAACSCLAQGVNSPGLYPGKDFSAKDCFNKARYVSRSFADSVKANQFIQGQRMWRVISLDDQQNKQTFNTTHGCSQVSLFEVIKFGLLDLRLNAFDSDDFNAAATYRLTDQQKTNRLRFRDSSEVVTFDDKGEEKKEVVIANRYYMGTDVTCFFLKEDWMMNAQTGKMDMRIIGIAPLVMNQKTGVVQPLFWLYYPEWKELLNNFNTVTAYDDEPMPYAQIFAKRRFVSQVSKESNVYDRSVRSIHHGEDIKQKTDDIQQKVNNKQADHFGN